MRLSFGQEMRQTQKQVLAPRMIQSMEILQLPILALQERIEQEMSENPLLEMQEVDPDLPEEDFEKENPNETSVEEKEIVVDENNNNEDDFERLLNLADELPETYEERTRPSSNRIDEEGNRRHDALANMEERAETLQDHLIHQIGELDITGEFGEMCQRIIYSLDSNGYLQGQLEDLLDPLAMEKQIPLAQQALSQIQQLDPTGVGARDLRECLLLQLVPTMYLFEQLQTLISSHLEDLQHNRLPVIERKTGYSIEMIQESLEELRKLNPKPGAFYSATIAPSVTPDVFLEQDDDGNYVIRLEEGDTPNLYISKYYRSRLMSNDATPQEKEFIKRKINSAQWLIESIEQRRSTLRKVAQAIVDHQTNFLEKGPDAIEPLKMQQIADKVGVHVTTISRAVDDKWIQTPRGIFALRRFFVGGTTSADGEEIAWDKIRLKLKEVIAKENKQHPFSDDELVKELAKHGVKVARRTVTKYRKSMDIPSSRQRRDWSKQPEENESSPSETNAAETNGSAVINEKSPAEDKPDKPEPRVFG